MTKENFARVQGKSLVQNGKEIYMKGVSLGGWLVLEDHMSGIPYIDHKIREEFNVILGEELGTAFFKNYQDSYITEKDFEYLHSLGINLIRLPFNYRSFEDGMNPGVYKEDAFEPFDRVIKFAKKYNMLVLPDLHAAAGSQAIDWNVDCTLPEALFWKEKNYQDRTINLWKHIVERYKDEPTIMGFELLGEPVATGPTITDHKPVQDFYKRILPALREIDDNHIFVLVANRWGKETDSLTDDLFEDPQVIHSPHYYPYESCPYDDVTEFPCETANRAMLEKTIEERASIERIPRPVLFAEFGINYPTAREPIYKLIEEEVDIFKEKGYHWCIWCYKDNGEFGFVRPKKDTLWQQFTNREDIKNEADKLTDACFVDFAAGAKKQSKFFDMIREIFPNLDFEYTQHQVREARRNMEPLLLKSFLIKLREAFSDEEILEFSKAFAWENCEINPDAEKMIKTMVSEK